MANLKQIIRTGIVLVVGFIAGCNRPLVCDSINCYDKETGEFFQKREEVAKDWIEYYKGRFDSSPEAFLNTDTSEHLPEVQEYVAKRKQDYLNQKQRKRAQRELERKVNEQQDDDSFRFLSNVLLGYLGSGAVNTGNVQKDVAVVGIAGGGKSYLENRAIIESGAEVNVYNQTPQQTNQNQETVRLINLDNGEEVNMSVNEVFRKNFTLYMDRKAKSGAFPEKGYSMWILKGNQVERHYKDFKYDPKTNSLVDITK